METTDARTTRLDAHYTTGQVAALFGVTLTTVRKWLKRPGGLRHWVIPTPHKNRHVRTTGRWLKEFAVRVDRQDVVAKLEGRAEP